MVVGGVGFEIQYHLARPAHHVVVTEVLDVVVPAEMPDGGQRVRDDILVPDVIARARVRCAASVGRPESGIRPANRRVLAVRIHQRGVSSVVVEYVRAVVLRFAKAPPVRIDIDVDDGDVVQKSVERLCFALRGLFQDAAAGFDACSLVAVDADDEDGLRLLGECFPIPNVVR